MFRWSGTFARKFWAVAVLPRSHADYHGDMKLLRNNSEHHYSQADYAPTVWAAFSSLAGLTSMEDLY